MKYSELERLLNDTTKSRFFRNGREHPLWKNPDTGEIFAMSNHRNEEVRPGTLRSILKKSRAKK